LTRKVVDGYHPDTMDRKPATELQRILWEEGRAQSWLVRRTGIDKSTMSEYVNGLMRPGEPNRNKIALALGRTDEAEILFGPPRSMTINHQTKEAA